MVLVHASKSVKSLVKERKKFITGELVEKKKRKEKERNLPSKNDGDIFTVPFFYRAKPVVNTTLCI